MIPIPRLTALALLILTLAPASSSVIAQSVGSRSGPEHAPTATRSRDELDDFAAEHYIAIKGSAEVRVEPTEIRVVLALTVDAAGAEECQRTMDQRVAALTRSLLDLGISQERQFVDFISLLPRYRWQVETQEGRSVAVERLDGFVMQTNVHLAVDSEAQARTAVAEALRQGIPDVLAFDYWSGDLDTRKAEAQRLALVEARRKSELLLELFETRPAPINVHESTRVLQPRQLYRSFQNDYSRPIQVPYRGELPTVAAPRPHNTYYHGPPGGTDVQSAVLPMRPQLSVISEVTLYYAAPDRPVPCPHHGAR